MFFFPLERYFTYFMNYWNHFDLKFTYWPGIEIILVCFCLISLGYNYVTFIVICLDLYNSTVKFLYSL